MSEETGYKTTIGNKFLYAMEFIESAALSAVAGTGAGAAAYAFFYTNDWKTSSYLTVISLGMEALSLLNLRRSHKNNIEIPRALYESSKNLENQFESLIRTLNEGTEEIRKSAGETLGHLDNISENIDKIGEKSTPL